MTSTNLFSSWHSVKSPLTGWKMPLPPKLDMFFFVKHGLHCISTFSPNIRRLSPLTLPLRARSMNDSCDSPPVFLPGKGANQRFKEDPVLIIVDVESFQPVQKLDTEPVELIHPTVVWRLYSGSLRHVFRLACFWYHQGLLPFSASNTSMSFMLIGLSSIPSFWCTRSIFLYPSSIALINTPNSSSF